MANLDRDLGTQVAKMVGLSFALDPVAEAIADAARANYAGHGSAASMIDVEHRVSHGVLEPHVVFNHPWARMVEMGHIYTDRQTGARTNLWVKGVHGLRNAAERFKS